MFLRFINIFISLIRLHLRMMYVLSASYNLFRWRFFKKTRSFSVQSHFVLGCPLQLTKRGQLGLSLSVLRDEVIRSKFKYYPLISLEEFT